MCPMSHLMLSVDTGPSGPELMTQISGDWLSVRAYVDYVMPATDVCS